MTALLPAWAVTQPQPPPASLGSVGLRRGQPIEPHVHHETAPARSAQHPGAAARRRSGPKLTLLNNERPKRNRRRRRCNIGHCVRPTAGQWSASQLFCSKLLT
jgi:hypothetical protein